MGVKNFLSAASVLPPETKEACSPIALEDLSIANAFVSFKTHARFNQC